MSIKSRMDKLAVVKSHCRQLYISEKERACVAAGAWTHLRHDAERKTADTEECAACSHLCEVQKQNYVITTEQ